MMKVIDMHDPNRVSRTPDDFKILFESTAFKQDGFSISRVELRHYIEKNDSELGDYSLITSFVETDRGSIEMIYDEGYRGNDPLSRTVAFLVTNLGISGLILRSIISLKTFLEGNNE